MKHYPLISVYTCVYNGERTLHRVFKSMKNLDYPNIEHVIVNDGSTDRTDELIQEYIRQVSFPVKYHKKENGGKHTALNVAWDLAEGKFLLMLDADDELLPDSAKFLVDTYYSIPEDTRHQYWCILGRCITQHGEFVGDKFPENINAQHWTAAGKEASKCSGEKLGIQVREYLAPYRFPEIVGLSHIPESTIWNQIGMKYGTWYTNQIVRVYYVGEGGNLCDKATARKHYNPSTYHYKWKLMHPEWYEKSFTDLLHYALYYFISDEKYRKHNGYFEDLPAYRGMLTLLAPVAFPLSIVYRIVKKLK